MQANSPIEKDASVHGSNACSGTAYNLNEENWWSAEFDSYFRIQMIELLPLNLNIMAATDYPSIQNKVDKFLEGAEVFIGDKLCYQFTAENSHLGQEWLQFECLGDGATGNSIEIV